MLIFLNEDNNFDYVVKSLTVQNRLIIVYYVKTVSIPTFIIYI